MSRSDSRYDKPIRGRGTRESPPNRFESQALEIDLEALREFRQSHDEGAEEPDPQTRFLVDSSRSALSKNNSPDIGFDVGLNPYRGCEHGCTYCLVPETPVLYADMIWRPIGAARVGDRLLGFDEHARLGDPRRLRATEVEAVWGSSKPTRRVITRNGEVVTTNEHRWLLASGDWSETTGLRAGSELVRMPETRPFEFSDDYRVGYVAGMTLGDGRFERGAGWNVTLGDREPLERLVAFLARFGVWLKIASGPHGEFVETRQPGELTIIDWLLRNENRTAEYERGFVAGFLDGEGHSGRSLRVSQVDVAVLERVAKYASSFGFQLDLEPPFDPRRDSSNLRLRGTASERVRFLSTFRPGIRAKLDGVLGHRLPLEPERVEAVERGPVRDVVDIQTSTGTFFAAGLATHNCYARPTHEYLGYSPGVDFETVIFVKPEIPKLLRRSLAAQSWKPQVIGMSGVTDCYQPVERKLGLTRRCLEVLAEFRNPVSLITKSRLITRDIDVLRELAQHDLVNVTISLTSLDSDLCRKLEPRAAQPGARLAAIRALDEAGVPVGVNLAPMIPALNDHEIPALLDAARNAGARWASLQMLRLPHAVKELFAGWLDDHFPDRKQKVLNHVRDMRDGKLNDPRPGFRMRGTGLYAEHVREVFRVQRRRAGFPDPKTAVSALSTTAFRRATEGQIELF